MNVTFDPAKDALNLVNHHMTLALAADLDWETLLAKPDSRQEYGEERMVGYALMNARLYCVIYVDRDESRRIISLRKANSREVKHYAKDN
jgi:uncharacterized DUF497 family protein